MSRKGVSSHGVISQMNLTFAFFQSIRNELQLRTEHARKKKVWRGYEGEERRLCTLPAAGGTSQLFAIITCFDGKSCLYP